LSEPRRFPTLITTALTEPLMTASGDRDEAALISRQSRLSFPLALHALIASFTGLLLGFDLCIAGAILTPVQRSLHLCYPCPGDYSDDALARCTCAEKQLAISAVSIGAAVGALFGGLVADIAGRRPALLASDLLFALGGFAMACATPELSALFFLGRGGVGLALGIGGSAASAYLAEIAPAAWRGRFLEMNELGVCSGCLAAYAIAYFLGDERWRVSIGLTSAVALVQLLLIAAYLHESPAWLAARGLSRRAARAHAALGTAPVATSSSSSSSSNAAAASSSDADAAPAAADAAEEERSSLLCHQQSPSGLASPFKPLCERGARRPLLLALGVSLAHAATAANTVLYYSRDILQLAGLSDPLRANGAVGLAKLAGVAAALVLADRLGRRKLLLGGTAAMIVALVGLSVAFADKDAPMPSLALGSLLVFILGWDVSWAGLMLAVVAEVLPLAVRGAGTGLAYSLYWVLSFVTAQFLETAMHSLGTSQTFAGIGVVTFLVLVWTKLCVPETANKTLEEMAVDYEGSSDTAAVAPASEVPKHV